MTYVDSNEKETEVLYLRKGLLMKVNNFQMSDKKNKQTNEKSDNLMKL